MKPDTPILNADMHIGAIKLRVHEIIFNELVWEDDNFDKDELNTYKSWAENLLVNFKADNVDYPMDFYNEIIKSNNFSSLESDVRRLWQNVSKLEASYFATAKHDEILINRLESVFDEGIANYNEHLSGTLNDDDFDEA